MTLNKRTKYIYRLLVITSRDYIYGVYICTYIRSTRMFYQRILHMSRFIVRRRFPNVPETSSVSRRINRMRGELRNIDCRGTTSIFSSLFPLPAPLGRFSFISRETLWTSLRSFQKRITGSTSHGMRHTEHSLDARLHVGSRLGLVDRQRARDDRSPRTEHTISVSFEQAPVVTTDGIKSDTCLRIQIRIRTTVSFSARFPKV